MKKNFLKKALSLIMTAAFVMSGVPALPSQAAEPALPTALANYDFKDYTASGDTLVNGDTTITLESVGNGVKPSLVQDESRGQVLKLNASDYGNRAFALLPSNPFAGQDVSKGLTLNFWTSTLGNYDGGRCLVDFEVAPATTGRAGTFAFNQQMVYWNTTDQNAKFTDFNVRNLGIFNDAGWKMVTMVVTTDGISFYSNGEKISHTVQAGAEDYTQMIGDLAGTSGLCNPEETNVRLGASLATYWTCANALIDDVSFYGKALSDAEIAALWDATMVKIPVESIAVSGPSSVQMDKTIQLTAKLTPADTTDAKGLTWESSNEDILTVDANGKVTAVSAGTATVTAKIGEVASEPFEITVEHVDYTESLEEGYYLAVYSTSTNFYAYAGNVEQETRSVYMAVSKDGKTFDVLNNGGGVIFSKNPSGTLRITDPRIFKEDGKFTVVAPDDTAARGYHTFTSEDGVHYYDDTMSATTDLTADPLRKSKFSLMLDGTNILTTDEAITLGNAVKLTEEEYKYITDKLGTVTNNGLAALEDLNVSPNELTEELLAEKYPDVTATYTDGSSQKFNIDWSGALDDVTVPESGTLTLNGKVVQTKYLNNLKELNGSTLPEDDPDNENPDFPSNYDPDTKKVYYDETKFIEGMADPCIFWDEQSGYYYMTASYFPEEGDAIDANDKTEQYDRVVLRRAKTLEGLQDRSTQVTIWKVGNQGYDNNGTEATGASRYIWAPEIHRVGNYWVIYFTESHGNGLFNIYSHALVLDGEKDPYETALTSAGQESEWKDYKMVAGAQSAINSIDISFCLDMTYFKDAVNDTSYVIWAGKPTASYNGSSTDLFIATVDEERPWVLTSEQVRITKSDYGWERVRYCVNEGATVLQNDGNIFMCYSVSGTGSEYAIGMLNAKAGSDLLNPDNWTKSPYPLLTSRDVDGEEGPGHNSFTVDKDGNAIFVYHARPTTHNYKMCGWDGTKSSYNGEPLNDPCRHARLKRVHWAADGTPILKMTYDDELTEEYQTVSVNVTLEEKTEVTVEAPVYWYDFEGTVDEVNDKATASAYASTLAGGSSYTDELIYEAGRNGAGEALDLNGAYGLDLNLPTEGLGENYTVSLWVQPQAEIGWASSILFLGVPEDWISLAGNGLWNANGGTNSEFSPVTYAQNEWQQFILSVRGGKATLYLNGQPLFEKDVTATAFTAADRKVCVGLNWWDDLMDVLIDDVKVYNVPVTADQAAALYETENAVQPSPADKTALQEAINTKVDAKDTYTSTTWKAYEDALAKANEVNADEAVTQSKVNAAADALKDAIAALEKRGDKKALAEVIEKAVPAADQDNYTEDSWKAYEKALAKANEVNADADATQKAIDAAAKALTEAQSALEEKSELPYVDIEGVPWAYDAIEYNYYAGIMTGKDDTHFAPVEQLKRAQFAAVLYKMNKSPDVEFNAAFPDVTEDAWCADCVTWALDNGIVTGYTDTNTFKPDNDVTRAELATMLYRYAKNYKKYDVSTDGDYSTFPDAADVQEFAEDAMNWAVGEGLITGKTVNEELVLDPNGKANRAECAIIIERFMGLYEN